MLKWCKHQELCLVDLMPRHSMAKQSMFFFPFDEIRNMYPTIQLREIINFQLKCALRIQHNLIVFKLNFVFLDSSFSCFSSSFLIGWFHGALSISKWLKVDFEFGTLNGPQFFSSMCETNMLLCKTFVRFQCVEYKVVGEHTHHTDGDDDYYFF